MSIYLCLSRRSKAFEMRVEFQIRAVPFSPGAWVLVCAMGLHNQLPSEVRTQGPFYGRHSAEAALAIIVRVLEQHGYSALPSSDAIWQLPLQREWRKVSPASTTQFGP